MLLNEDIHTEEATACLLCGTEGFPIYKSLCDRLYGVSGIWNFYGCPQCHFMWLNPRPTEEDNQKVYAKYFTHTFEDVKSTNFSKRKRPKYYIIANSFGYAELFDGPVSRIVGKMASILPSMKENAGRSIMWIEGNNKGTLLDVGCGHGRFLARMKRLGWQVTGVEPDGEAVNIARRQLGLNIIQGTLERANLPDNSFDTITIRHAIEHVHNPIRLLRECRRALKPRGKLIVTTPNMESVGHRYFRHSWYPLDPPRHLCIFSMRTLKSCAEKAGLRIEVLRTSAHSSRRISAASWQIKRGNTPLRDCNTHLKGRYGLRGSTFTVFEDLLRTFRKNAGEELVMIATR